MCSPYPCAIVTTPLSGWSPAGDQLCQTMRRAREPRKLPSSPALMGSVSASMGHHLDLHRGLRSARVLDLQRRVAELETVAQQRGERAADLMAVLPGIDHDVRRYRWEARCDLPDVQVVDLGDALLCRQELPDLVGVDALGSGLHHHPHRGLDQT